MAVHRVAPLLLLSLFSVACGAEVGDCEDPQLGKDTVLVAGSIQYGGQAIMNIACAQGCHSSSAKGSAREGAPGGLDFDLRPVDPNGEDITGMVTTDAGTVLRIEDSVASGLRERQRRVFEDRDRIWQQVQDGLMPPGGMFAQFKRAIVNIVNSAESNPCVASTRKYEPITEKSSQDVLRRWLACGAPIVETTSEVVETNGAPGSAGFQYQSCGDAPAGDGGASGSITIETVHARIFEQCVPCHSPEGEQEPDLETPEKAYQILVGDSEMRCNDKPYVTKGSPSQSYFYDIVAQARPGCSARMPPGGALTTSEIKLISDWIQGGALREADVMKSSSAISGGLDGGVR
jgi:hypothetical protein